MTQVHVPFRLSVAEQQLLAQLTARQQLERRPEQRPEVRVVVPMPAPPSPTRPSSQTRPC